MIFNFKATVDTPNIYSLELLNEAIVSKKWCNESKPPFYTQSKMSIGFNLRFSIPVLCQVTVVDPVSVEFAFSFKEGNSDIKLTKEVFETALFLIYDICPSVVHIEDLDSCQVFSEKNRLFLFKHKYLPLTNMWSVITSKNEDEWLLYTKGLYRFIGKELAVVINEKSIVDKTISIMNVAAILRISKEINTPYEPFLVAIFEEENFKVPVLFQNIKGNQVLQKYKKHLNRHGIVNIETIVVCLTQTNFKIRKYHDINILSRFANIKLMSIRIPLFSVTECHNAAQNRMYMAKKYLSDKTKLFIYKAERNAPVFLSAKNAIQVAFYEQGNFAGKKLSDNKPMVIKEEDVTWWIALDKNNKRFDPYSSTEIIFS